MECPHRSDTICNTYRIRQISGINYLKSFFLKPVNFGIYIHSLMAHFEIVTVFVGHISLKPLSWIK